MMLRTHYQINEIFNSIQGEGVLVGTMSTFIRLQGCTVGCFFCDTKYTWAKGGEKMATEDIINAAVSQHIVITGGEPTMYDLDGLLVPLQAAKKFVQLETSGQNSIKGMVSPDWITWSPKENLNFEAPYGLKMQTKEVKWVVDESLPFDKVMEQFYWYVERAKKGTRNEIPFFVMMPEGCPPRQEMISRTLVFLEQLDPWMHSFFRYGDRIQYRIGVR